MSFIVEGLSQIVFPKVCVCCGRENTQKERQICSFCLHDRFPDGNPENALASSDTLLPEGVHYQHALWQFDKGGDLQHLLHQLKYQRLTTIGVDIGRRLGERVKEHSQLNQDLQQKDVIVVPVPLHYWKYRSRGFNQAFKIAQGFQDAWPDIPISKIGDIIRTKNTTTQTGFSLERRLENMESAFKVKNKAAVKDKFVVIVDDVFTTGATTFEMSRTLQQSNCRSIAILTVAQA